MVHDNVGTVRSVALAHPQISAHPRLLLDTARSCHAAGRFPATRTQALAWLFLPPAAINGRDNHQDHPARILCAPRRYLAALRSHRCVCLQRMNPLMRRRACTSDPRGSCSHRSGGVRIPHSHGLVAHLRTGPVLLHAACAMHCVLHGGGSGDIGHTSSDTEPAVEVVASTPAVPTGPSGDLCGGRYTFARTRGALAVA